MNCFIGIDVPKATPDLASLPDGERGTVTNAEQGLAELAPRPVALGVYQPRRPQASLLFRLVQDHRHRLRQIFAVDPLRCPTWQGTMRVVACITPRAVIDQILAHLCPRTTPPGARTPPSIRRSPTWGATRRPTATPTFDPAV